MLEIFGNVGIWIKPFEIAKVQKCINIAIAAEAFGEMSKFLREIR